MSDINEIALGWVIGKDTGTSSKTIWSVMMGVPEAMERPDIPYDPSDFGRCYRLLSVIPEWRERLDEMPAFFPEWEGFVEIWPQMEALWVEESPSGKCPKLYGLMQQVREKRRARKC